MSNLLQIYVKNITFHSFKSRKLLLSKNKKKKKVATHKLTSPSHRKNYSSLFFVFFNHNFCTHRAFRILIIYLYLHCFPEILIINIQNN